jgi:hypothetical protein
MLNKPYFTGYKHDGNVHTVCYIYKMALPNIPVEWLAFIRIREVPSLKFGPETNAFPIHKSPYYSRLHNQCRRKSVVDNERSNGNWIDTKLETGKETYLLISNACSKIILFQQVNHGDEGEFSVNFTGVFECMTISSEGESEGFEHPWFKPTDLYILKFPYSVNVTRCGKLTRPEAIVALSIKKIRDTLIR